MRAPGPSAGMQHHPPVARPMRREGHGSRGLPEVLLPIARIAGHRHRPEDPRRPVRHRHRTVPSHPGPGAIPNLQSDRACGIPAPHILPFRQYRSHRHLQSHGPACTEPPTSVENPGTGRSRFWRSTSSIHARSAGCAITLQPVASRIAFAAPIWSGCEWVRIMREISSGIATDRSDIVKDGHSRNRPLPYR